MLLICEGLDRTGKSTLAEQLLMADPMLALLHFDKPKQHPLNEYLHPIEHRSWDAVFDRYHWGERVWPTVFGRSTDYDAVMHAYVELALESRGAVVVQTRRDLDEVKSALLEDDEPLLPDDVERADALYDEVRRNSLLPSFTHNIRSSSSIGFVALATRRAQTAAAFANITPRWVGSLEPEVLLVGDVVGPGADGHTLPFVPFASTSGHFLINELLKYGGRRSLQRTAIVNSSRPNGRPEPVHDLWQAMWEPPVVALGRNAELTLLKQDVPFQSVQHPQYVRRFERGRGPGWYAEQIEKASRL